MSQDFNFEITQLEGSEQKEENIEDSKYIETQFSSSYMLPKVPRRSMVMMTVAVDTSKLPLDMQAVIADYDKDAPK